ncbi:hypothetical protein RFI_14732, partial [Reticulomyxa filosa]
GKLWLERFEQTKTERRKELHEKLSHLRPRKDGPIILMVTNYGYSWLFLNWVCSIDNAKLSFLRQRTLIVVTDERAKAIAEKAGFLTYYPHWLGNELLSKIDPNFPDRFALGAHKYTVALQISQLTDLIAMGHDVILQDTDIIWKRDPLSYLMQLEFRAIDIQMGVDGRNDDRGPGNSGFIMIRSNCRTKIFMNTMQNMVPMVLFGRSDQIVWNTLLREYHFRMISFTTLTTRLFISGFQINLKLPKEQVLRSIPDSEKWFLFHASWTTDGFDKIDKFHLIDEFHFTSQRCPQYFDRQLLPDLKIRQWYIRDKQKDQEKRLTELGFVRDTSNGIYNRG